MKSLRNLLVLLAGVSLASVGLAQGTTASLIDLRTDTVLSHFTVGLNPSAVAWADNIVAYVVNDGDNTLVRLDMEASPPTISATYTFADPNFDAHGVAINPAGTRALVTGDSLSVYLLDLTATPFTVVDTIPIPVQDAGGVAFYAAGNRGIVVNESNLLFLDLTVLPTGVTTVVLGSPALGVAVNNTSTRAS